MKKIMNEKVYDTDKAEKIADIGFSNKGDFAYWSDELMKTKRGNWFLYCGGGPTSMYAESVGNNSTTGSEHLRELSAEEAVDWLIENNKVEALEKHFPERMPEDA